MKIEGRSDIPDLQTQLESLFDQVWQSESDWQLWDRIDAMVEQEAVRERRGRLRDPSLGPDIGQ